MSELDCSWKTFSLGRCTRRRPLTTSMTFEKANYQTFIGFTDRIDTGPSEMCRIVWGSGASDTLSGSPLADNQGACLVKNILTPPTKIHIGRRRKVEATGTKTGEIWGASCWMLTSCGQGDMHRWVDNSKEPPQRERGLSSSTVPKSTESEVMSATTTQCLQFCLITRHKGFSTGAKLSAEVSLNQTDQVE